MVKSVLDESNQFLECPKAHILVEKCGIYKTLIPQRGRVGRDAGTWELEGVRNAFKTERRWKSQKAWGEGRHLRSRGIGNWALVPRVTQGQVYQLERETAIPRFPYSQVQEMINRSHSPSIPMEPRNAVLL